MKSDDVMFGGRALFLRAGWIRGRRTRAGETDPAWTMAGDKVLPAPETTADGLALGPAGKRASTFVGNGERLLMPSLACRAPQRPSLVVASRAI